MINFYHCNTYFSKQLCNFNYEKLQHNFFHREAIVFYLENRTFATKENNKKEINLFSDF